MQSLMRDLRYTARQLRRSPGFTITVVLTLALGIGATTAIFSCIYGLLLESLPFPDEHNLVAISTINANVKGGIEATFPDYLDWRRQQTSFSQIAAYSAVNPTTISLFVDGRAEPLRRVLVSGNFFSLLGVKPLAGRLFDKQDNTPGRDHVAVISASAWTAFSAAIPKLSVAPYRSMGLPTPSSAYFRKVQHFLQMAKSGFRSLFSINPRSNLASGIP